jgi:hypothetical protein
MVDASCLAFGMDRGKYTYGASGEHVDESEDEVL